MNNPKLLLDIIHPDDKEMYRRHLHKIDDPEHNGTDFRIITRDGQVRWFTHTCSPIYINDQFLGRRGSSIDITEHKKLEERLSHTQRLEYLGRFAGGIAHDFNNVLASINTFSHLLAEESRGNKTASDYIKYINIATKLGKNLTANLLSFGKRQNIALHTTSLNNIISGIADILRSLVDEEISLQIKLTGDDLPIAADKHQLEQVLINLCTNARDAMPGGGTIKIVSQAVEVASPINGNIDDIPAGCYMRLSVADNGGGINPADLSRICEPFFTTKDPAKGTGLGLAIIHDIIKKHGAFFDVQSIDGKGTTFAAYFPVKQGSASLTPPLTNPDLPAPPLTDTAQTDDKTYSPVKAGADTKENIPVSPASRGTILVSDDDEMVRNSLIIQLQQAGFNVLGAANGKKAIRLFIDHKDEINLVILDLLQPLRNGREIYEVIYKNLPRLPVIFISGDTNNLLSPEILARPKVTFMAKPLVIEDFMTLVENMTSGKA
jgi:signal transduction histidine kinase/CheY-like chemotaxis protein